MEAEIKLLASNGERQENHFRRRLASWFPTIFGLHLSICLWEVIIQHNFRQRMRCLFMGIDVGVRWIFSRTKKVTRGMSLITRSVYSVVSTVNGGCGSCVTQCMGRVVFFFSTVIQLKSMWKQCWRDLSGRILRKKEKPIVFTGRLNSSNVV